MAGKRKRTTIRKTAPLSLFNFTLMMHTSILRSKALNLDGSINNPAMHGNFTNIPIDMGSEWMYVGTDIESE